MQHLFPKRGCKSYSADYARAFPHRLLGFRDSLHARLVERRVPKSCTLEAIQPQSQPFLELSKCCNSAERKTVPSVDAWSELQDRASKPEGGSPAGPGTSAAEQPPLHSHTGHCKGSASLVKSFGLILRRGCHLSD